MTIKIDLQPLVGQAGNIMALALEASPNADKVELQKLDLLAQVFSEMEAPYRCRVSFTTTRTLLVHILGLADDYFPEVGEEVLGKTSTTSTS